MQKAGFHRRRGISATNTKVPFFRRCGTIIQALIVCLCLMASAQASSYPWYEWHHRAIFYFTPDDDEQLKQFELEAVMRGCQLRERDVIILIINKNGETRPSWVGKAFDIASLQQHFNIDTTQHTAILIGKDGMEKSRWQHSLDWSALDQVIDDSPIRQEELRQQPHRRGRCQI